MHIRKVTTYMVIAKIIFVEKWIRWLLLGPQNRQYKNGVGVRKGQRHIPNKNFSLAARIQRIILAQKSRDFQLMIERTFIHPQSWTKVLGHFCVSGVFFNSRRSNLSPHPTNNVGRVYPEFFQRFNFV